MEIKVVAPPQQQSVGSSTTETGITMNIQEEEKKPRQQWKAAQSGGMGVHLQHLAGSGEGSGQSKDRGSHELGKARKAG